MNHLLRHYMRHRCKQVINFDEAFNTLIKYIQKMSTHFHKMSTEIIVVATQNSTGSLNKYFGKN